MLFKIILIVQLVVCILLVGAVLIQQSKGSAAGMGFGGGTQGVFGASGGANFMTRFTAGLATVFFILGLVLSGMVISKNESNAPSVMEQTIPATGTVPDSEDLPTIPK